MALYKISSSRVNNIEAAEYTGSVVEQGLIWYDPVQGVLRLYNGEPGGQVINGTGTVTNSISNGNSNVVVYPDGNVAISVKGTANVAVFSNPNMETGNLTASGNITAGRFVGNGAGLTGVVATEVGILASLSVTGAVQTGSVEADRDVTAVGNISGNYILGNGSLLTGIASDYGNANVAAYLPTYTGTVGAGSVTATGNISGNYIFGNGSQLTGIASDYGNANVADFLTTYNGDIAAGSVSATGNVAGEYFIGNGSLLTGVATDYGNANVAAYLPTYTGTLSGADASLTGNITANYYVGNGSLLTGIVATEIGTLSTLSVTGNIVTGNLESLGTVSALGNIVGDYFIGNGSQLTGIANTIPVQAGQTGKYLTTSGTEVKWNDALGSSLTFNGGESAVDPATILTGGTASDDPDTAIEGGSAASDYELTLSALALTGQFQDITGLYSSVPVTANSTGITGQIAFDDTYLYICIASNTWRRATIQSW